MPTNKPDCECEDKPPPSPGDRIRVLLIDDDREEFILTRDLLDDIPGNRFQLDWVSDYAAGVDAICDKNHDVFLLDYRLGIHNGIDLLNEAHHRGCSGPVIMLTGVGQADLGLEAMRAGAHDYLEKASLTAVHLERAIRFSLAQYRASADLEQQVAKRTQELAQANAALQEADRRKDIFLATLAHELRNPLAPIRNSLEIMRLSNDTGPIVTKQRERIERQVNHLIRLVEDLLDVSRITADKLRLNMATLNLHDVIEAAVDMCHAQIEHAGLTLHVDQPDRPIPVKADHVRLTQVLGNLLHNASKFTEPGGHVTIRVEVLDRTVCVNIKDTGVGIPTESLTTVFGLFTQIDRTAHRTHSGLGIGLALASRLVQMHNGEIRVHSDGLGHGATFTVELPLIAD